MRDADAQCTLEGREEVPTARKEFCLRQDKKNLKYEFSLYHYSRKIGYSSH